MYALREHIDWLYRLNLIPILPCQDLQIPGEGCGITGDIDDTLRIHLQHDIQQCGITALPGRIYNDHIGLFSVLAVPLRKHLLGFSHEEFSIRESVPFGILPRVLDRCRDDLNTVNLSCLLRKKERDCSDSAVQVPDVLSTGKTGEFQRFAIEAFCLLRIHLVEGKR